MRLVVVVGLCLIVAGVGQAAVTTTQHATYAFRPCSTCKEVRYPTEQECEAAAYAEAERVGQTREIGSAVYTCITRFNVIATFQPAPRGTATLTWTHEPNFSVEGFRIVHGTDPSALTSTVQIDNAAVRTHTLTGLPAGTRYFALRAFGDGVESKLSNVLRKTVL